MKRFALIAALLSVTLFAGCAHISRPERNTLVAHSVSPSLTDRMVKGEVLSLEDVIELSTRDVPPQLIINYLYSTRAIYNLDKPAMARLNKAKVSPEVVKYLVDTPSLFGPRPYYGPRYYPAPYPYYYDPYYPWGPYPYPYYYGPTGVVVVRGHWHH